MRTKTLTVPLFKVKDVPVCAYTNISINLKTGTVNTGHALSYSMQKFYPTQKHDKANCNDSKYIEKVTKYLRTAEKHRPSISLSEDIGEENKRTISLYTRINFNPDTNRLKVFTRLYYGGRFI